MFKSKNKQYSAAMYIRLSREDGDKAESNSVSNQRELIESYLQKHSDITVVCQRIDDGFSGVSFDRPAFKDMLSDIKNGLVDCVIVKDLSRFGRNYIESGRYIEQIFPFMGVRFIAINDNIDTIQDLSATDGIILPFKNLMNDFYSRDISIKARSGITARQKRGDYVGSFPTFGYIRSKEQKGKLEIDDTAAEIVKEIFRMRIAGHNNAFISDYLNNLGFPSPMAYKELMGFRYSTSFKLNAITKWSAMAVSRILKNEIYTGVLIQGKETTVNYKVKKRIKQEKEDWIRVENTHEAIISKEDFALAQKIMLCDTRTGPNMDKVYLFSGFLKCADCGNSMVRKQIKSSGITYVYYVCSLNKEDKRKCSPHRIRADYLESAVLMLLKNQITLLSTLSDLLDDIEHLPLNEADLKKRDKQLQLKKEELLKYNKLKISVYEDYKDELLSKDEYLSMKNSYESMCEDIAKNIDFLEDEIATLCKERHKYKEWIQKFIEYGNISELSRTTLALMIEEIIVYDNKKLKVVFRYADEFKKILKLITEVCFQNNQNELLKASTKQNIENLLSATKEVL